MANLIDCVDPRGIRVILTESNFDGHIRHGHYDINVADIKKCLEDPVAILVRDEKPERHLYYRKGYFGNHGREIFAKVVVNAGKNPSEVITAFLFSKPDPKREKVLWSKP